MEQIALDPEINSGRQQIAIDPDLRQDDNICCASLRS